jgi:hypothetical protein
MQPTLLDVVGAVVGRVGYQLFRQLASNGHAPLNHGLQMGSITGPVVDRPRSDLVGAIGRRLAVVALVPAAPTFEDRAVWADIDVAFCSAVISLSVSFGIVGGSVRQVAPGNRQRINATQWILASEASDLLCRSPTCGPASSARGPCAAQ